LREWDHPVVDLVDDEIFVALPATHPLARKPTLRLRGATS
jgi:hypothetical protein